jgi:RHS repeat-associated protein
VIAQAEILPGSGSAGSPLYLVYDGHGSTRLLATAAGANAIVNDAAQIYRYDAYGNAFGFNPSTAATTLLYSGEQFDSRIQQQYLRARYYDPATGCFNGLDPSAGNIHDPQSLHKYLYAIADPVNGTDLVPFGATHQLSHWRTLPSKTARAIPQIRPGQPPSTMPP